MTPEIGHFALILALLLSLVGAAVPLLGAARRDAALIGLAPTAALGQCVFVLVAFFSLMTAYVTSDFSVVNVALNSHTAKPLLYKITGVWGNHEGSLLLWVAVLSVFAAGVAASRRLEPVFKARVLSVQAMIAAGFLLFSFLTSNPFIRNFTPPAEGNGLNPILQDPGLAFHPPLLYLGYVGFSVAFSFAVAALIEGRVDAAWARLVRPWVLTAWSLLTLGIALGSWWAYYELGWGGWWFWDPVENASLMPWLAGTALLHSVRVVEKREALKHWTVLLAILTFGLSLIGTFLVRSGVLTSVHAFANDPDRGIFILAFLTLSLGGALALYAVRANVLNVGKAFHPVSREGALVINNFLLFVATLTVFLGTLYPLFLDAVTGTKISVGPPYFAATVVPLFLGLMLVMAVAPFLRWTRRAAVWPALVGLRWGAGVALAAVIVILWRDGREALMGALGFALATWVLLATAAYGWRVIAGADGRTPWQRLARVPASMWGLLLAHGGVAVIAFGITASGLWETAFEGNMRAGGEREIAGYTFRFDGVREFPGPNYEAQRARFLVTRGGAEVAVMTPETRRYSAPQRQTTEAAIRPRVSGDLYAVIGDPNENGTWSVRLYHKPLVHWIWVGAFIVALGGGLAAADGLVRGRRRRPHAAPARQAEVRP